MKYEKSNKEVWFGNHAGVRFEINHWISPANSIEPYERHMWTYYIFIHIKRIPNQYNPNSYWLTGKKNGRHVHYDYYKHPVLRNIDFHYGCTWYSKEHGFDNAERIIKVGCDYMHYGDEGMRYSLDDIVSDVKNTIEDFRNRVGEYKYWCCGNGKLYDLDDGVLKDETFYSKEYYGDKEWFKDFMINEQNPERSVATGDAILTNDDKQT